MKKFLFASLIGIQAFAGQIVKVQSGVSGTPPSHAGSGAIFQFNNELFVISSDHVLIRSNQAAVHAVTATGSSPMKATILMADWARGFSLLKIHAPPNFSTVLIPDFADLDPLPTGSYDEGWVHGFPARSNSPIRHQTHAWRAMKHSPGLPIHIDEFLTADTAHVEFGMSGGFAEILYAGKPGVLGILSHQILNPMAGNVEELKPGSPVTNNQAIAIPFPKIKNQIEEFLKTGQAKSWNFFWPTQSTNLVEQVYTGSLLLWLSHGGTEIKDELQVRYETKTPFNTTLYPDHHGFLARIQKKLIARAPRVSRTTPNSFNVNGVRKKGDFSQRIYLDAAHMEDAIKILDDPNVEVTGYFSYENIEVIKDAMRDFTRRFNGCSWAPVNGDNSLCERLHWISQVVEYPFMDDFNTPRYKWTVLRTSDLDELLQPKYDEHWSKLPRGAGSKAAVEDLRRFLDFYVL